MITLIAALDRNRAIGRGGGMPWHLPDDLKRFKALTLGKPVLMGRKTALAIGRPLPGRENLVLTRGDAAPYGGQVPVHSLAAAIDRTGGAELCVIGGGEVYRLALPYAARLALTEVDTATPDADTFFPGFDAHQWREVAREHHAADAKHPFAFDFVDYLRADVGTPPHSRRRSDSSPVGSGSGATERTLCVDPDPDPAPPDPVPPENDRVVEVAAGVLIDRAGRVLLIQRLPGKHLAGTWEFPGGKVEPGETIRQALARELDEELGVAVHAAAPLVTVPWRYPTKSVRLHVLRVTEWRGEPVAREGNPMRWVPIDAMDPAEMPAADAPIVAALRASVSGA